jgi:hypothetical protein
MRIKRGDLDTPIAFRIPARHLEAALRMADEENATKSEIFRKLFLAGFERIQEKRAA